MFAWLYMTALLVFSAFGAYRLRAASPARYGRFVYVCAVLFGLLPVSTGDWGWALIALPVGLVVARLMIQRRAANFATPRSDSPAT